MIYSRTMPPQRILDVATGTSWSARNLARRGATVTGVDISPELLAAAADISAPIRPSIEFRLADAEELPFDDCVFDGVISTFGVMFSTSSSDLGTTRRSGGIFRSHCPTQRRTISALIAIGVG